MPPQKKPHIRKRGGVWCVFYEKLGFHTKDLQAAFRMARYYWYVQRNPEGEIYT